MRHLRASLALVGLFVAGASHADAVKFTWVPYSPSGPTNNGVCAPATCPAVGSFTLSSAQIDSTWAALVGATSSAPGPKTISGSAGTFTGTTAIQTDGLSAFSFSWNNAPNVASLALGTTLNNIQVGGAGWTVQYNSTANAYILFNVVTFNGAGTASQGLQVSSNGTIGSAGMTNATYSSFGLTDYGYWKLSSYTPAAAVPLPGAALLMLSGLAGLAGFRRSKAA